MDEWVKCSVCGLRHSARSGQECPRCARGEAPQGGVSRVVISPHRQGPAHPHNDDSDKVQVGVRIAGVLLFLSALWELYVRFVLGRQLASGALPHWSIPALFYVGVGGMLLAGSKLLVERAKSFVFAGAVVFPIVYFALGESVLSVLQVVYFAGLVLLVVGEAGRLRLVFGTLLTTGIVAFGALAIVVAQKVEDDRTPVAEGLYIDEYDDLFSLEIPSDHWFSYTPIGVKRLGANAELWLTWPERSVHIYLVSTTVETLQTSDIVDYTQGVADRLTAGPLMDRIRSIEPFISSFDRARLIHGVGSQNGANTEVLVAVYLDEGIQFQLVISAPRDYFRAVEPQLQEMIHSLRRK